MRITDKVHSVRARLKPETTLVCVSKKKSAALIEEAYSCGCRDFGENYLQELEEKQVELNHLDINWHYIGALQSNKVRKLVGKVHLIHSVDRESLINEIGKRAKAKNLTQNVLLQVNVSDEETKGGISPSDLKDLLCHSFSVEGVSVIGLMGFGAYVPVDAPEEERAEQFVKLCKLKSEVEKSIQCRLPVLSMGVSHDYELAVRYGSTMVRVGSAIFGERK